MDIPCVIINDFFLPIFCDILVTTGITKNVVDKAAKHPCSVGHIPAADVSPLNSCYYKAV